MGIIDILLERLESRLGERETVAVRVGLGYTGVVLDDGSMGVAYTFRHRTGPGCTVLPEAGALGGNALELARLARSEHVVEAAIGLAAVNAAAARGAEGSSGDVLDNIRLEDGDRIGMVGFFGPVVQRLKGKDLTIFETEEGSRPGTVPADAQAELLPQMDVVILTSTSLINHTADGILAHCANAREVVMLGPSTPLFPDAFSGTPVTLLAGMVVEDTGRALEIIGQGGGTRLLGKISRKVNVRNCLAV